MGESISQLPFPMGVGAKWVQNKINLVLSSYQTATIQTTLSSVVAWSTECALIRAIEPYVSVDPKKLAYCKKMPSMANKKEKPKKIDKKEIEKGFALSPEERKNVAPEIIDALEAISLDLIGEEIKEEIKQERFRSQEEAKPLPDEGLDELFDSVDLEDRKPTSSFGKMEKFILSVEHKKRDSSSTYKDIFRETFHFY
jgi:hypothetical protein